MKIFPLHLIPNDTKFDFLRLRWISPAVRWWNCALTSHLMSTTSASR